MSDYQPRIDANGVGRCHVKCSKCEYHHVADVLAYWTCKIVGDTVRECDVCYPWAIAAAMNEPLRNKLRSDVQRSVRQFLADADRQYEGPLYSVGTWDTESQAYTPQDGVTKAFNLTAGELRVAIRELRKHRRGNVRDGHDSDSSVLIERTDGKSEAEILKDWKR